MYAHQQVADDHSQSLTDLGHKQNACEPELKL